MRIILTNLFVFFSFILWSQSEIKLMHYNLLNFGSQETGCKSVEDKITYLKNIVGSYSPDIFTVNEMKVNIQNGENTLAQVILDEVFNETSEDFSRATDTYFSSTGLVNMLYYDNTVFELLDQQIINNALNGNYLTRMLDIYTLYLKKTGEDSVIVDVIVAHFKAGSGDTFKRNQAAEAIRAYTDQFDDRNFILCGDLNIYKSSEPAFQTLIDGAKGLKDPINTLGNWNNNGSFAEVHTQSTRTSSGCGASGGMDDRFDFILMNDEVLNNTNGLGYVPGTYEAFGQDGSYFNGQININNNASVDALVASSLFNMSDHLPVVSTLTYDPILTSTTSLSKKEVVKVLSPATDNILRIVASNENTFKYEIYTLQGQLIQNGIFTNGDNTIKLNSTKPGSYFITLRNSKVVVSKPFICQ